MTHRHPLPCIGLIVLLWGWPVAAQLPPRPGMPPPPPSGRQVEAADGDIIVVDGEARVSLLRRREAEVRVVVLPDSRAMLVIADWQAPAPAQDLGIERVWRFTEVDGQWPLEPRWQGRVTLVEAELPRGGAAPPLALETPAGRVEFHGARPGLVTAPGAATVITFSGMSGSGQLGTSFDEAERQALSGNFRPSFSSSSGSWAAGSGASVTLSTAGAVMSSGAATPPPMPAPPLMPGRFQSSSAGPVVIKRVDPQWPPEAQAAGVQGMVVVQMAVAPDGTVRDTRVLRSVPMLDEAALAAARQWRFAPAGPEGRADPVMFTAVFAFTPR